MNTTAQRPNLPGLPGKYQGQYFDAARGQMEHFGYDERVLGEGGREAYLLPDGRWLSGVRKGEHGNLLQRKTTAKPPRWAKDASTTPSRASNPDDFVVTRVDSLVVGDEIMLGGDGGAVTLLKRRASRDKKNVSLKTSDGRTHEVPAGASLFVRRAKENPGPRAPGIQPILDELANYWGPLKPYQQQAIREYLEAPTSDRWQLISSMIINPGSMRRSTIWQYVILADPSFPRQGPSGGKPWPKIPDSFTLLRALKMAANDRGGAPPPRGGGGGDDDGEPIQLPRRQASAIDRARARRIANGGW